MIFVESLILILAIIESVKLQKPSQQHDNNPSFYNIGGVLSNNDSATHFHDTIAVSFYRFYSKKQFFKEIFNFSI